MAMAVDLLPGDGHLGIWASSESYRKNQSIVGYLSAVQECSLRSPLLAKYVTRFRYMVEVKLAFCFESIRNQVLEVSWAELTPHRQC